MTRGTFKRGRRYLSWNLFHAGLGVLLFSLPALALAQQPMVPASVPANPPPSDAKQQPNQQTFGMIHGKVVDQSGIAITGASAKLMRADQSQSQEAQTDEEGQFYFFNVAPGPFQITVGSEGLTAQTISGTLKAEETFVVPQIVLAIATQVTEVRVGLPPVELAEAQMAVEEKQRVLGFIPNFYVSYEPNAAPLTPKLKFKLALKTSTDPMTFAAVGLLAGVNQATNRWEGYGQGAQGYAKRYGASYADVFTGTYLGGAVLPTLLKQDPRYFYKGTGSKTSRLLYALGSSVFCKGDNGKWEPNYSNIGGNLTAGAIAYSYYPAQDRHGAGLALSIGLVRLGETAMVNVLQEFVLPKLTPNAPRRASNQQ
jgi:Carboxypeptidase regulatory-like domain